MRTELEKIQPPNDSSISLMVNPDLRDFFYWHFHPEYELVFIEGTNGNRHVGQHLSRYVGNDLVLIGSYIPHLNFDFGVQGSYEEVVVHIRPDFLRDAQQYTPELQQIHSLLELAQHGIAFGEKTLKEIVPRMKKLPELESFDRFLELLNILHQLSQAEDQLLLHQSPVKNQYTRRDQERLQAIYRYIDQHYQQKIEVSEVAEMSNLSNAAFCRYFKKMTKLTFTEFVNNYRIDKAKKLLLLDNNVTEACYACGFESLSYFNRTFKKVTGINPTAFKQEYLR